MYKCDICGSKETYVKEYTFKFDVKGKEESVKGDGRFCSKCDSPVYDSILDNQILRLSFRKEEELLGIEPEKIINLRKKYNLTQYEFSKIIGCAKKTLISYEKGTSIPNDIYLITIKMLLDNPEIIGLLIESNKIRYDVEEYNKIKNKIGIDYFKDRIDELTEYNGFQELSIEKITKVVTELAKDGIYKTKLLKEMFYVDFKYFEKETVSITGLEYLKYKYGPVPKDYERILRYLEEEGYISIDVTYKDNSETYFIKTLKQTDYKLDKDELDTIKNINKFFKDYTVSEIVEYSHKERAYKETKDNERISYYLINDFKI